MKCEHCGKNEVTFVYRSNINGTVEEHHLCSQCAEKLGYTQRVQAGGRSLMQNFFGRNSLLGSGFFDDFFVPMPSLMGRMLEDPSVNPFIDPQEWQRFCDTMSEQFRQFMANGN